MMDRVMQVMMSGMLVLVVPAFVICAGIALVAYRRRGASADPEAGPPGP